MRKLLPLWVISTGVCLGLVLWTYFDIKKGDWTKTAIEGSLGVWWFFIAHFQWEKSNRES